MKWLGSHVCFFTFPLCPPFFRPCFCYCFFYFGYFTFFLPPFPVFLLEPVTFISPLFPYLPILYNLAPSSLSFHLAHLLSIISLLIVFIPFSPCLLSSFPSVLPPSPLFLYLGAPQTVEFTLCLCTCLTKWQADTERRELQLHTEPYVYDVTALKRSCLCSDKLLSAVVDGTQLKLHQQMEKHYREACRATSHAPYLCEAATYIYGDVLKAEGHIYLLVKHILGNQERKAHGFPTLHQGEFWTIHACSLPFLLHLSFALSFFSF